MWLHWIFFSACRLSLAAESRGYFLIVVHRLLCAALSLVAESRLYSTGSVVVALGL